MGPFTLYAHYITVSGRGSPKISHTKPLRTNPRKVGIAPPTPPSPPPLQKYIYIYIHIYIYVYIYIYLESYFLCLGLRALKFFFSRTFSLIFHLRLCICNLVHDPVVDHLVFSSQLRTPSVFLHLLGPTPHIVRGSNQKSWQRMGLLESFPCLLVFRNTAAAIRVQAFPCQPLACEGPITPPHVLRLLQRFHSYPEPKAFEFYMFNPIPPPPTLNFKASRKPSIHLQSPNPQSAPQSPKLFLRVGSGF